jgi:polyphosphate glucokinase
MTTKPRVLMIDVGGTNVKLMLSGSDEMRKFPSGRTLAAGQMTQQTKDLARDWSYDCVSIGFPGLIKDGKPLREPLNLGGDWLGFDFEKAFGQPVRVINDAALQALAAYQGGRMLFIGFGTSIGCGLVLDGTVTTVELGLVPLSGEAKFMDKLTKASLKERGVKRWSRDVNTAVALLRDVFWPEDTVIGGGNAKFIEPFPEQCRRGSNRDALRGAERLWPGTDMLAEPWGTTWRVTFPRT